MRASTVRSGATSPVFPPAPARRARARARERARERAAARRL